MRFSLPALTLLVLQLVTTGLGGQEVPRVMVRCALFPGGGKAQTLQLQTGDDKSVEVTAWAGRLAPEQALPRLPAWRFGSWNIDADRDRRVFMERGRVTPLPSARQFLLMVPQGAGPDAKLNIIAIPADAATVREGGIVVINLTNQAIRAVIKDQPHGIAAGKTRVVNPATKRQEDYPVRFLFEHRERWRPFVETVWFHGERRRRLAIVVPQGNSPVPRLFTMQDVSPPAEAAGPP